MLGVAGKESHSIYFGRSIYNRVTEAYGEDGIVIIREDDPRKEEIAPLLREHLDDMAALSPPESIHAFDVEQLRAPDITFYAAWEDGDLLGCGALRELDPCHGEIKSMRTVKAHMRKGVGAHILEHLIAEAKRRGYTRLSLETGTQAGFAPARALYVRFGFKFCDPFGEYKPDPNSVFMTLVL